MNRPKGGTHSARMCTVCSEKGMNVIHFKDGLCGLHWKDKYKDDGEFGEHTGDGLVLDINKIK